MDIQFPKSQCLLCKSDFSAKGMSRHVQSCLVKHLENQDTAKSRPFIHLYVKDTYTAYYWLHLKAGAKLRLKTLDSFLRQIWLECCGHMSAFYDRREELDMGLALDAVFKPGKEISHEYDFGSTTYLTIKAVARYDKGLKPKQDIEIMARNAQPQVPCSTCGKAPSTLLCSGCYGEENALLCKKCAKKHECGEEMLLPFVNSPRTGVCGYTGN